jgi:hypothetical protein
MYQWLDRAPRGRNETRSKGDQNDPIPEIAGPRVENLVEVPTLLAARRGDSVRIEGATDPDDPDGGLHEAGTLVPGPQPRWPLDL